jgi:hypothetical protein
MPGHCAGHAAHERRTPPSQFEANGAEFRRETPIGRRLVVVSYAPGSAREAKLVTRAVRSTVRSIAGFPPRPGPSDTSEDRDGYGIYGTMGHCDPAGHQVEGRVQRVVDDELDLSAASEPLADEAVTRAGGTPGGTSSKLDVALEPGQRADSAAVTILTQLTAVIEANLPGTLADVDSEFLHDLRVAVRRTRSLQRELKAVFPPAELTRWRSEFRWLQEVTGPSRDLDYLCAANREGGYRMEAQACPSCERPLVACPSRFEGPSRFASAQCAVLASGRISLYVAVCIFLNARVPFALANYEAPVALRCQRHPPPSG